MMRDDFDQLDIDTPIPYHVTPRGRRDLQIALAEEAMSRCSHQWDVNLERGLVCRWCGAETTPRKLQSIPSHVGPRERR
jgi:hypothetical protein